MPQMTATGFSWAITLNGSPIEDFGGIRFSFSESGLGTSGCCSTQLEFDVYDPTNFYGDMLLDGAEVTVSCPELFFTSQTYFCDSISTSKKICKFVCYDRICRTDRPLDISGIFFGEDDAVSADGVLSAVCYQCGFASYGSSGDGLQYIKFSESQLENITCRRALELVSEALAGVWVCGESNTLYLACLGGGDFGDYAYCEDYSEIDFQGRAKITTLVMTNSETGEVYNFGGEENGTVITINSPFASAELGLAVWGRIGNYVYTAWHCDKADVTYDSTLKNMSSLIFRRADVEGDRHFATTTEFDVDSTGVYFSGGSAAYNEWNYEDYTQRQLALKLEIDRRNGNAAYGKNGIRVYQNLNTGAADKRKKAAVVTAFKSEV
ncbi:MAG: hypothetical protein K2J11_11550 [Oscillospiraceae bacterium]|nr:hypothetical protein [Oscillospiraceae bacterium]